jgi:hypothetical protein
MEKNEVKVKTLKMMNNEYFMNHEGFQEQPTSQQQV